MMIKIEMIIPKESLNNQTLYYNKNFNQNNEFYFLNVLPHKIQYPLK